MKDGSLVVTEQVDALLARCRLVEVVSADARALSMPREPGWIPQGTSGRILRFVDARHNQVDAERRIAAAFPAASISTSPLSLRDIFVALARNGASTEAA
jgi:ABC-2 type transport system ATP-binding protein